MISWLRSVGLVIGLAVLAPPPATASCDHPNNLVSNCSFDTGIEGWELLGGAFFEHEPLDGHLAPGSLRVKSSFIVVIFGSRVTTCVETAPDGWFGGQAFVRLENGVEMNGCSIAARGFDDPQCNSVPGVEVFGRQVLPSEDWTEVSVAYQFDPAFPFVQLYIECYSVQPGGEDHVVLWDDVSFGKGIGPTVFDDGFESGDTSAWSTSSP